MKRDDPSTPASDNISETFMFAVVISLMQLVAVGWYLLLARRYEADAFLGDDEDDKDEEEDQEEEDEMDLNGDVDLEVF